MIRLLVTPVQCTMMARVRHMHILYILHILRIVGMRKRGRGEAFWKDELTVCMGS